MEKQQSQIPFYLKCSQVILGTIGFFYIMYIGQSIIIPLIFSTILAILLNPFVNFLHRHKVHRVLSIIIALVLAIVILAAMVFFISSQLSNFSDALPLLKKRFGELSGQVVQWISTTFNVNPAQINTWVGNAKTQQFSGGSSVIGATLITISSKLVVALLVPVYIFMILFYKPLLLEFISKSFSASKHATVAEVLHATKTLIQSYLVGLMMEAGIVAALNATGLLIIGVDYAVLLGIIGAILNIIPYIGGIIAIALPMIMAITTKSVTSALFVLGWYVIVQLVDNNFIVPKIVASKVKVNALVSIVVVLIGGALWGVPGMFLSLPLTAIIKVICDHVEPLHALGFLLGDTMPPIGKRIFHFQTPPPATKSIKPKKK